MAGLNKVTLIGNVGKTPDVKAVGENAKVARFTIATTETYRDKNTGKKVMNTEWHNIVLWNALADIAEKYLDKGKQVYIEGKLKTRSWEDDNGEKKFMTEIIGDNLILLGSKGNHQAEQPEMPTSEDGLPF